VDSFVNAIMACQMNPNTTQLVNWRTNRQ